MCLLLLLLPLGTTLQDSLMHAEPEIGLIDLRSRPEAAQVQSWSMRRALSSMREEDGAVERGSAHSLG